MRVSALTLAAAGLAAAQQTTTSAAASSASTGATSGCGTQIDKYARPLPSLQRLCG